MSLIENPKWQDQARTVLIATIDGTQVSGITSNSRYWNKVQNSGVPIANPDPPPPPPGPSITDDLLTLEQSAATPQEKTDARARINGRPVPGRP